VGISKMERFANVPKDKIKQITPHDVIKKPEIIFE